MKRKIRNAIKKINVDIIKLKKVKKFMTKMTVRINIREMTNCE